MNYKRLIKMWVNGASVAAMAKHFNVSDATIYTHMNKLRKMGVKIPKRDRVYPEREINVKVLNSYIEQLTR